MIRTRCSRLVQSSSVSGSAILGRSNSSTSTLKTPPPLPLSKKHPTHLIFGANTDVGKTLVSTNLVQANIQNSATVQYIKPLQCGGSDEGFLDKHLSHSNDEIALKSWTGHTLFNWDTPASPHMASRLEDKPVSDTEILMSLTNQLAQVHSDHSQSSIYIETAGGVLSPAPASPSNTRPRHAHGVNQDSTSHWGWSTQADLYQPLRLPVVLVGDGRLGGISATLSALESLLTRGYDIHAILLLDESAHSSSVGSNISALREYASRAFKIRGGGGRALLDRVEESIVALPPVPPLEVPLHEWFQRQEVREKSAQLDETLKASWVSHVEQMEGMREKGKEVLWWPFTQHQGHNEGKVTATLMDGASGDYFSVLDQSDSGTLERMDKFDACASWWTQGVGHGESSIGLAAAAAAGKFGHVIFPDVVHEPATVLSDRLVNSPSGPGYGWASRVFFTDDGSTAMEVAIKMGMKKFCFDHGIEMSGDSTTKKLTVCAQKDCYHGDTLGVMDVAEPSIFNEGQHPWYEPKGLFMAYPTVAYQQGSISLIFPPDCDGNAEGIRSSISKLDDVMDVDKRIELDELYPFYMKQIKETWDAYEEKHNDQLIGSVVIEPILLGAGGMKFVDPLWQRALMDVARSKSVPVVFDEVAAGLYRLGVRSCREILKSDPDIASYAKLLTGGLIPMSVTLASEEVFNTFLGDSKGEALLHGHSYTAHPLGCVSAIHALDTFETLFQSAPSTEDTNMPIRPYFDQNEVADLSTLPNVQESMSLGTVLAVTIKPEDGATGYGALSVSQPIVKYLYENGVYARPLGNVVYIMVSPLTSRAECGRLLQTLRAAIERSNQ